MQTETMLTYSALQEAYDYFNTALFGGALPSCLITLQRKAKSYGFFCGDRFTQASGTEVASEIALNPSHFATRKDEETLSTLAHEMVHLWQHYFGGNKVSTPYHNGEWANKMQEIGLVPSSTGAPGGKRTGQKMSHYIQDGGAYQVACRELLARGGSIPYVERLGEAGLKTRAAKTASKTKYTCPCCGQNAWAKPGVPLMCGGCREDMTANA